LTQQETAPEIGEVMIKIFAIACTCVATFAVIDSAWAQMRPFRNNAEPVEETDRPLLRGPNLTISGETVPNPGKPQIGSETEAERQAQERSKKATRSICSNC
jgi:hypothetical protein